jgi:GTPase Era involved in 16S rRNA processing
MVLVISGFAVSELTYRPKPQYASKECVACFDDETKIPDQPSKIDLEGGVKDSMKMDQFEDEGGAIIEISTISHLEKHEVAMLCKKFSSWAKALKLPLGDLRSMNAKEKIEGLRELVLENYGNEFPYLETLDIEALDLWILTKIKDSSLKLTIVSEV